MDRGGRKALRAAAIDLIRVLADYGHETDEESARAFEAGRATLGGWAQQYEYHSDRANMVAVLNHSLDVLLALNHKGKEALLHAISTTAAHDRQLAVPEAELIRAVCATLDYPLPPILVHRQML